MFCDESRRNLLTQQAPKKKINPKQALHYINSTGFLHQTTNTPPTLRPLAGKFSIIFLLQLFCFHL
jgi:hypothetical protein